MVYKTCWFYFHRQMKIESRAVFKTVWKWYILSTSGSIQLEYVDGIFFFWVHLHRKSNGNRDTKRFIAYLCYMTTNKITPEKLWARQQISPLDVDYDSWNERRASIQAFSQMSQSCIFTVDVFKERYDFASDNFATIFGYNPIWIKTIRKQGDLQEERIHPDDRTQLIEHQIEHG